MSLNTCLDDEVKIDLTSSERNKLDRAIHRKWLTDAIIGTLAVLAPSEREAFIAYHYKGLPVEEIGRLLGCTLSEAEKTLMSARKRFFERLSSFRRRQLCSKGG